MLNIFANYILYMELKIITIYDHLILMNIYLFNKRLYLEAPLITEDAVEALKMVSSDESRGLAPLQLLKEMVVRRPTKQLVFLNVLLCHTGHENNTVRN